MKARKMVATLMVSALAVGSSVSALAVDAETDPGALPKNLDASVVTVAQKAGADDQRQEMPEGAIPMTLTIASSPEAEADGDTAPQDASDDSTEMMKATASTPATEVDADADADADADTEKMSNDTVEMTKVSASVPATEVDADDTKTDETKGNDTDTDDTTLIKIGFEGASEDTVMPAELVMSVHEVGEGDVKAEFQIFEEGEKDAVPAELVRMDATVVSE